MVRFGKKMPFIGSLCVLLLVLVLNVQSESSNTCSDVLGSCQRLSSSINELPETQKKLFYFFSGGLTQIVWDKINGGDSNFDLILLSNECRQSITQVYEHLEKGSEWAFRGKLMFTFPGANLPSTTVIDASSKSSSGLLDGTLSSYGDYDQCLELESQYVKPKFAGKYCMAELMARNDLPDIGNITKFLHQRIPALETSFIQFSLCLPSTCTSKDVDQLVSYALSDQPFEKRSEVRCDTQQENSWTERITNMSTAQMISL